MVNSYLLVQVCPPVVPVENGITQGSGTSIGSRYLFTCKKGFTLIGPDTIHCGKNGQWDGTTPKCVRGSED